MQGLIQEINDPFELLVVEIKVAKKEIRIISGYGPQENWSPAQREPFFQALEDEVVKAELAGKSVFIEADFNSKLGKEYIPNDPHTQDKNGKLLADIVKRQNLTVANGLMVCNGTITRKRVTTTRTEESAISFIIVSEDLVQTIEAVNIDEKREHVLTRISKTKNGSEHKQSDHNIVETKLKIGWDKDNIEEVKKMFNLKNKKCQKKFREEMSKTNNLSKIFDEEDDLDNATEKFMRRLEKVLYKCFKKVTIKNDKHQEKQYKLYDLWKSLRTKTDDKSKEEMKKVKAKLANKYFENLQKASQEITCAEGGNIQKEIWKLKKHMCPRSRDPPTAMVDNAGSLVTDQNKIKDMAQEAYKERLRNRPIKEGLENIKEAKERVAEKLIEVAKLNKTEPWDLHDLGEVLKSLKKNKSRDPNDLANKIFKPDIAGEDLKLAILKLMNRIKSKQIYPKCRAMF